MPYSTGLSSILLSVSQSEHSSHSSTLCLLSSSQYWVILQDLLSSTDFFQNQVFRKIL